MVLQKALSFMASLTPKSSLPQDLGLQTPKAATGGGATAVQLSAKEVPARLESGSRAEQPKPNQQEMELDDFDGDLDRHGDEEEKTQSYESEDESGVRSDLIEISLEEEGTHLRIARQAQREPGLAWVHGLDASALGCARGHVHILDYLLSSGISLDALDKKGDSLLHKAAANGQHRVCQWLLQCGFNVQAKNNNSKSALDVAQEHLAVVKTSEAARCEAILARENANTF